MGNGLEFFIAWRYLKARRRGVFTLLTSLIGVGGITLGVASLIITLGVMSGFHKDIREKILALQPHLVILKEGPEPFIEYHSVAAEAAKASGVTAVSPFVYGQIILRSGQSTIGAIVKGINLSSEEKLVGLAGLMNGDIRELGDKDILLGYQLARNLGVGRGQEVVLVSPGQIGMVPRMEKYSEAATFKSGMYEYDSNLAYVSLASGQKLFGLGQGVTGLGISLTDPDNAAATAGELKKNIRFPYLIRSWQEMNSNLFAALKLEKIMMFIILTLIILVASFNIISNLLLLTVEKSKEIGVLSAMGLKRFQIGRIFFFEGLIIGLTGIISGTAIGTGLCFLLNKYKFIHLPADVYYLDTLPVRVIPGDIASVVAATLLITLFAAVYPAYQATKLDPLDAIRYG
jgi:lipoprotein-releasing system permease protein